MYYTCSLFLFGKRKRNRKILREKVRMGCYEGVNTDLYDIACAVSIIKDKTIRLSERRCMRCIEYRGCFVEH